MGHKCTKQLNYRKNTKQLSNVEIEQTTTVKL